MVQKILINTANSDFSFSRTAYTWLMKNKGWEFIGMYDTDARALAEVVGLKAARSAPIPVIINSHYYGGGRIDVDPAATPVLGGAITYTFTPSMNKRVQSVIINGIDNGVTDAYTFPRLTGDQHLLVVFEDNEFPTSDYANITVFATPGGYVSDKGRFETPLGETYEFYAQPYPGYTYRKILVDGVQVILEDLPEDKTFFHSIENVSDNHHIEIHFKLELGPCNCEMPKLPDPLTQRFVWENIYGTWDSNINARNDPDLIAVYEYMGATRPGWANGVLVEMKIVEIPDDTEWEIRKRCDGTEVVATPFEVWS